MKKYIVFIYPKCGTCKRALDYLNLNEVDFEFRDIVKSPPSIEELKIWNENSDFEIKKYFNTSGLKYKELKLKDKLQDMSDDEKFKLLASDGMLIKRPLVVMNKKIILLGFKEDKWNEIFK